jgi:predicted RNA binding protein YcfA (HicA-like mRNA interferase family)
VKIPVVSSMHVVRCLRQIGFVPAVHQGKGSHVALFKIDQQGQKRLVIVPRRDPLPAGTLHSIMKQSGLSREEFIGLLTR